MDGHKCVRCGQYWSSQSGLDRFHVINVLCPLCLPKVYPATVPGRPESRRAG